MLKKQNLHLVKVAPFYKSLTDGEISAPSLLKAYQERFADEPDAFKAIIKK